MEPKSLTGDNSDQTCNSDLQVVESWRYPDLEGTAVNLILMLFAPLALMASPANAEIVTISGLVSGTWTGGNEYHVVGDVFVETSLVIESGTIVKFMGDYMLHVQAGSLEAEGAEFASGSTNPQPSDWQGILVTGSASASLRDCGIRHAHRAIELRQCSGGVIEGNAIGEFFEHGVFVLGSNPTAIRFNVIDGKNYHHEGSMPGWKCIQCDLGADAIIESNTLVGAYNALYNYYSSPILRQNILAYCLLPMDANYGDCPVFEGNVIWTSEQGDWWHCIEAGSDNIVAAPEFCGEVGSADYFLQSDSPCSPENNDLGLLIGALPINCGPVATQASSWSQVKSLY